MIGPAKAYQVKEQAKFVKHRPHKRVDEPVWGLYVRKQGKDGKVRSDGSIGMEWKKNVRGSFEEARDEAITLSKSLNKRKVYVQLENGRLTKMRQVVAK